MKKKILTLPPPQKKAEINNKWDTLTSVAAGRYCKYSNVKKFNSKSYAFNQCFRKTQ